MYFNKMNSPDGSILKCRKVGIYNNRKKGKSVIYDTKCRAHRRKELVNSTENTLLASSNMGEAGWRLMTQKTAKHNHFNVSMVPIHPEKNPHNPKGKLAKDNRR